MNTNYVTIEFLNVYMKLQLCSYVMARTHTCSHRQNLSTKPCLVSRRLNPVTFLISCSFWSDKSQRRTQEPPNLQNRREGKCSWESADCWHFHAACVKS